MSVILILLILSGAALGWVLFHLHKVPEGFEDNSGFYLLKRRTPGSTVVRTQAAAGTVSSLKQAQANR